MGRNHPLTFSWVEHAVGLSVAHVAALGLAVVLQSAHLAEVVAAPSGGEWKERGSEGAEHSPQATRAGGRVRGGGA